MRLLVSVERLEAAVDFELTDACPDVVRDVPVGKAANDGRRPFSSLGFARKGLDEGDLGARSETAMFDV